MIGQKGGPLAIYYTKGRTESTEEKCGIAALAFPRWCPNSKQNPKGPLGFVGHCSYLRFSFGFAPFAFAFPVKGVRRNLRGFLGQVFGGLTHQPSADTLRNFHQGGVSLGKLAESFVYLETNRVGGWGDERRERFPCRGAQWESSPSGEILPTILEFHFENLVYNEL